MIVLKMINLTLAFVLELAMLVAYGYWGVKTRNGDLLGWLLAFGVPFVVILIWARFMAPKSTTRLKGVAYLGLKTILFGGAALALAAAGQPTLALIFVIAAIINQILLIVWKDETLGA